MNQAIAERVFPGASTAVLSRGRLVARRACGRFTYEPSSPVVEVETIFDVASLSKVAATTAAAMLLYERGQLSLDAPVAALLPEFAPATAPDAARRRRVTVRMLLAHSSGLPAWERLYERARTRDALLAAAASLPLQADPGTHARYSDIGFILLGEVLERLAGEALDRFCHREVFGPLGMTRTCFRPPQALRSEIPPTQDDHAFRHKVIQGEVQDENAWTMMMGGVAGHAGLFSTAGDLTRFAHCMLSGGAPILRPATVELFTHRESTPLGTTRALGWDTPSRPSQSGRHFFPRSFGHLGYTGASLWIDPERQWAVVLLTNRTWPDPAARDSQQIKQVRPQFHDAVLEALK